MELLQVVVGVTQMLEPQELFKQTTVMVVMVVMGTLLILMVLL
jgi:hypothetical protein